MSVPPIKPEDIRGFPHMVNWFDPRLLAETGLRHLITRVFGQFADQRAMQAMIDGFDRKYLQDVVIKRYDYSNRPELKEADAVWVDFAADTGDGFDSTYAIASLISADALDVPGAGKLPGGKMLILGGDQVYPFPTRQDYLHRFIEPFQAALPGDPRKTAEKRSMFALPGNHDWYDGLNSFDNVFCKSRHVRDGEATLDNRIGGWLCPQHRSYWSIRLPHNWWIWGADIQLSQYLDAGQVLYFKQAAREMAQLKSEDPKLILCIAEPSWNYDRRHEHQGESNLDSIINIALDNGAHICAILSGDLHHYSRYYAKDLGLNLITAGGGGAYFSPTHALDRHRKLDFAGESYDITMHCKEDGKGGTAESCWPSRRESRWMSTLIMAFPIRNYGFSIALGVIYWLMAWMYSSTTVSFKGEGKVEAQEVSKWISSCNEAASQWCWPELTNPADHLLLALQAGVSNPPLGLLTAGILGVLFYYADSPKSVMRRFLMAFLHWCGHIAAALFLYATLRALSVNIPMLLGKLYRDYVEPLGYLPVLTDYALGLGHHFFFPPLMWFVGGALAGGVWGTYLTIASFMGRHTDQAFSTMRLTNFRHFLRMKIEPQRLTIYPIGLKTVPLRRNWKVEKDASGPDPGLDRIVPSKPFKPELIDGPIVIDPNTVRGRDPLTRTMKKPAAG